jgi:hypothetical protein
MNGTRGPSVPSSPRRRADHEADAKGHADQPEGRSAFFRRGDIGDIGIGRRETRPRDPRDDPPGHQPAHRRGKGLKQIVEPERQHRRQQDRAPSETIGQVPDDRREHELHGRIARAQPSGILRGLRDRDMGQMHDQPRKDRDDDAKAEHVDQDNAQHEAERGAMGHAITFLSPARCHAAGQARDRLSDGRARPRTRPEAGP